jgi:LCP family protein required for cell wall assembly
MGRRAKPSGIQTVIKSSRSGRPPRGPRRLGRVAFYFLVLIVILAVAGAVLLAYVQVRIKSNQTEVKNLTENKPAEPMNVLILGSDSRADLSADQIRSFGDTNKVPGKRADTIILLHLDERRGKAIMVHFPRDLRVTYPSGKVGKINGVYSAGAGAMVETVSKFTGLDINHYIEVDFNGFNKITDVLGGVDVYFEKALKDTDSGLDVPKGCVRVEGPMALSFVRARKIDTDFGRINRQQLFVKLMVRKIATPATFLNPAKVIKLINTFAENVSHDSALSLGDVRTIALRVKSFNPDNLELRVVPSAPASIGGVSYVIADQQKTQALFQAIRDRAPLPDYGLTPVSTILPGEVRISLLNGTVVDKLAANEAPALSDRGFVIVESTNTTAHPNTIVYFKPGSEEKAKLVAQDYGVPTKPLPPAIQAQGDVALVLGEDFANQTVKLAPQGEAAPPAPGSPPPPKPLVHACDAA